MKQSLRSRLLQYLNFSNKSDGGDDILFNMYKMGLWETYFFYYPSPYIATKNLIKDSDIDARSSRMIHCWKKYFGIA